MYCRKCGNQMMENEKFCASCGTAVEHIESANNIETENKSKIISMKKIAIIGGSIAIILFLLLLFGSGDVISNLKNSTLPAYSENITIGEAFDAFFIDPSWSSYKSNDIEVVVFNGYFYSDSGDKIKVRIEMTMNDDWLSWEEIVLYNINGGDTTYLNDYELESLLSAIYENGTFSWYW